MECYDIGIEAFPIKHTPPPPVEGIPAHLLAIMKKYKFSWRITQLAKPKPRRTTAKYVAKPVVPKPKRVLIKKDKLDAGTIFYSEQLAMPILRQLVSNKIQFSVLSRKMKRKYNKRINLAWTSIYNFYKNKERLRRLRLLRKSKEKKGKPKPKVFPRTVQLAVPKKIFRPKPSTKKKKIFSNFKSLLVFAAPKSHIIQPPARQGVSPRALTYQPTEAIFRLAKPLERVVYPPLEIGKVKKSALRFKVTPKLEALAVPKRIREKAKEEDEVDPWAISKTALKYKATPRILELAKPLERD